LKEVNPLYSKDVERLTSCESPHHIYLGKIVEMLEKTLPTTSASPDKIGIYNGEVGQFLSRKMQACENEWNADVEKGLGPYSFDKLLFQGLENAEQSGKSEVLVLDFGCGEGELFKSFLQTPPEESEALTFLNAHPNLKVKLVGITDIPGLKNLPKDITSNSRLPIDVPESMSVNCEAYRIIYAVTAAQPLEDCFQANGISNIDLCVATHSLSYFSVKSFKEVLATLLGNLDPHGAQLVAAQYNTRQPGFKSDNFLGTKLDISPQKNSGTQEGLKNNWGRLYYPDIDIQQEIAVIQKAVDVYIRLGVLTDEAVHEAITPHIPLKTRVVNFLQKKPPRLDQISTRDQEDVILSLRSVTQVLAKAESALFTKQHAILEQGKKEVLLELQKEHPHLRFGPNVIELIT
jgi:hypothetical protein